MCGVSSAPLVSVKNLSKLQFATEQSLSCLRDINRKLDGAIQTVSDILRSFKSDIDSKAPKLGLIAIESVPPVLGPYEIGTLEQLNVEQAEEALSLSDFEMD